MTVELQKLFGLQVQALVQTSSLSHSPVQNYKSSCRLQAGLLLIVTAKNTNGNLPTALPIARRCVRSQKQEEVNEQKPGMKCGAAGSSP